MVSRLLSRAATLPDHLDIRKPLVVLPRRDGRALQRKTRWYPPARRDAE
jgi:hypothetical protein